MLPIIITISMMNKTQIFFLRYLKRTGLIDFNVTQKVVSVCKEIKMQCRSYMLMIRKVFSNLEYQEVCIGHGICAKVVEM